MFRAWVLGPWVRPEARGEVTMRTGRGFHHGGRRALSDLEGIPPRSALSDVLFQRGDGCFGSVDRGGDNCGVPNEHIGVLVVLRVRQFIGVGGRLALAFWRPRSAFWKEMRSISRLRELSMLPHRCEQCLMYGGGAARVEKSGELGCWSRERPSSGPAAARSRSGAVSKALDESLALYAQRDPG